MQAQIQVGPLLGEDDWTELAELVGADESALLQQLLRDYREAGAKAYLLERAYIDREFSAAYLASYSTHFHPYIKYCQRLHLLGCALRPEERRVGYECCSTGRFRWSPKQ